MDQFKRRHGQKNAVIDIDYESFDDNFVGIANPVPTIMFPDWRHLIKKWRNQLLNVTRLLVIGHGVTQLEHLMKTFESDRMRCGLWKSDVFVKDKQNVQAAVRVLQKEVRVCMEAWDVKETPSVPGCTCI